VVIKDLGGERGKSREGGQGVAATLRMKDKWGERRKREQEQITRKEHRGAESKVNRQGVKEEGKAREEEWER
jgi:hypothetical protein